MIKDKKIVVVGAGGLLGGQVVKELLIRGAKVIASDLSSKKVINALVRLETNPNHNNLQITSMDLNSKNSVFKFFEGNDQISGAVNCSYPRNKNHGKSFYDVDLDNFNENISLLLGSSFNFMQHCALYFKTTKSSFSLVNISSIYGVIPPKFEIYKNTNKTMPIEYAAAKSALINISKYVSKYVCDSRFRVNVVSPGGIFDEQPKIFLNSYKNKTFGKGMLASKDIIGAIIFLLSSDSEFVNGQNIIVDDGFSL